MRYIHDFLRNSNWAAHEVGPVVPRCVLPTRRMSTNPFHGDRPIEAADQDRFGLSALAARIADALTTQAAGKGFVMGVEGRWGSGKSSLLALIVARLRAMDAQKVAVVEFRPWLIGDRDQLLAGLFEDLVKAIAGLESAAGDTTRATVLSAKDVAEKARRFASHLGSAGKFAGLAGMFVPGASAAGTVLEGIASAAKEAAGGPTLAQQKDDLAAALVELSCRIVVTIDDVDRLEPKEVAELLRLVRSVADFPNISYILCYDAAALGHAIEQATQVGSGSAYLEKIIQTQISVPRPESFALRTWFKAELAAFATCEQARVPDLLHMIDETGGRSFDTARSVVRSLDGIRAYWPSLERRVDLVDLVWLRIIGVALPSLYHWIEEYLTAYTALAAGRVHISESQRLDLANRLDSTLAANGLEWSNIKFELQRHLPGIEVHSFNQGKEERLFARARSLPAGDFQDQRLASPNHSRLYFTLVEPVDSVTGMDVADLLGAANKGPNDVGLLLLQLSDKRGDTGTTKTERLLDQMREMDDAIIQGWPVKPLVMGLVNIADELAKDDAGDDWGFPRIWYLGVALLKKLSRSLPAPQWAELVETIFATGRSFEFVSRLLRDETFGHGFFGDRPNAAECITTPETFETIRKIMLARYEGTGLERLLGSRHTATMLYAWSQAGGHDELVRLVAQRTADDDASFIGFLLEIRGTSTSSTDGSYRSLSLEAIHSFFANPADVVRRVLRLVEMTPPVQGAELVVAAINRSIRFDGGDLTQILDAWDKRLCVTDQPEGISAVGENHED